jgi:hypothetical protein
VPIGAFTSGALFLEQSDALALKELPEPTTGNCTAPCDRHDAKRIEPTTTQKIAAATNIVTSALADPMLSRRYTSICWSGSWFMGF